MNVFIQPAQDNKAKDENRLKPYKNIEGVTQNTLTTHNFFGIIINVPCMCKLKHFKRST